jgi:hypothetical protein
VTKKKGPKRLNRRPSNGRDFHTLNQILVLVEYMPVFTSVTRQKNPCNDKAHATAQRAPDDAPGGSACTAARTTKHRPPR